MNVKSEEQKHNVLHSVFPLNNLDVLEIYLRFRTIYDHCFILESLESDARWTFIGWDPLFEISVKNGHLKKTMSSTGEVIFSNKIEDPNSFILQSLNAHKRPFNPELPPFSGGFMGYFSYDWVKYSEPKLRNILEREKDGENFNDCDLMFFDKIIAIDHKTKELHIILNDFEQSNISDKVSKIAENVQNIYEFINYAKYDLRPKLQIKGEMKYSLDEEKFSEIVKCAKTHINDGDIFQVVLSLKAQANATGSLFDVYKTLRKQNPSPYMFYMSSPVLEIAGCSPETLVSTFYRRNGENKIISKQNEFHELIAATYPLAGSRRRGKTPEEDELLRLELLHDEKECAEHNMLVDLGRNDIGKIAKIGSVAVEKYMDVLKFEHIMHIGSKVVGCVKEELTALDVISSVLPAGTLSGAPKVRACEIIDNLEDDNRGIYGGCLGYLSVDGQMDMCITIRTSYMKNGKVYARAGAGIVMDSDPHLEYIESKNKLKSVINAIDSAANTACECGVK